MQTINVENLNRVLAHIEANPSCWKQEQWHCGTSHCFGGWAQILSGKEADEDTVRKDARQFLGLTETEATDLFYGGNTLPELRKLVAKFASAGYDRAGYNRVGYDRDGYSRDGYDRAGYDRDGYERDGYNRAGYDRDGYNRAGYDRDGLDAENLVADQASI